MIAMALICRPTLLIADEPTTALDVTIQAQILKLMIDLQQELQMALLLITHDLGVVANVADEIVVMYHGEVMESGTMDDLFQAPEHPYLQALLRAVPRFGMEPGERLTPIREIAIDRRQDVRARRTRGRKAPGSAAAAAGGECQQELRDPQGRLLRRRGEAGAGGRRRQLRGQARRVPGAGRRIRLRQDHPLQDHHAGADAGYRAHPVQRRQQAHRDAEAEGRRAAASSASASSSCSRTRWARSTRACRSTTSSPSRWSSTASATRKSAWRSPRS